MAAVVDGSDSLRGPFVGSFVADIPAPEKGSSGYTAWWFDQVERNFLDRRRVEPPVASSKKRWWRRG